MAATPWGRGTREGWGCRGGWGSWSCDQAKHRDGERVTNTEMEIKVESECSKSGKWRRQEVFWHGCSSGKLPWLGTTWWNGTHSDSRGKIFNLPVSIYSRVLNSSSPPIPPNSYIIFSCLKFVIAFYLLSFSPYNLFFCFKRLNRTFGVMVSIITFWE